jgi:hypothetical protein
VKNKIRKPVKGILVRAKLIEITDPAEQGALDRRIAAAEKILDGRSYAKMPKPRRKK